MNTQKPLRFNVYGKTYEVMRPTRHSVTPEDRAQFAHASKILDKYHGLPEQLQDAFEEFTQIQSKPLFHAGLTTFLITYSYIQGFSYEEKGLEKAYGWLQGAQEIAPDELGVLLAGFDYYLAAKKYPECRELLERGLNLYPNDFELQVRRINFLTRQGTVRQIENAVKTTEKLNLTKEQKQRLLALEARAYLDRRQWNKSIEKYKKLTKLTPDNPWAWNNMSIAQLETKNAFTAYISNRKALSLMDFGAARSMQKQIQPVLIVQTIAVFVAIGIMVSVFLF
ncbi:MAG: tetratricopeptide repeat protein [Anaerolineae bacterium]|nr:tetratricopeptide repeat protein [Anaerolineae bacterium]